MSDQFIETNIIIGYTVNWDRLATDVQQYVDTSAGRANLHTSSLVLDEAEDVINERRALAKQAARQIFADFTAPDHHPPVDQIVDFVRDELSQKRDAVVDHVIQHIKDNEFYYAGLTQTDSPSALSSTSSDIDSDFDNAIETVRLIRRQKCPELNCTIFADGLGDYSIYSVFDPVNQILDSSPNDRDILMDSFHLAQDNGIEQLYFITNDGDLLDNESQLESILGPIDIETPHSIS